MPMKGTPTCLKCKATESPMWTNAENLGALCLNCVNETKDIMKKEQEEDEDDKQEENKTGKRKIRQTRSYKTRLNPLALPKTAQPKSGKGRRQIFKQRPPLKAPMAVATPVTSNYVFHKGSYIQIGDIVSMTGEDGDKYYAQIRGLLTDQYCKKSAVITWLLPTKRSPPPNVKFDPATYVIGPEEEVLRDLDCMEFIMHAPSDYFMCRNSPYPNMRPSAVGGYIWTTMENIKRMAG